MPARSSSLLFSSIGFVLVTVFVASPLIDYRHLTDASYEGDSRLVIWTLAWDSHAILTGAPLFDANMFHPAGEALAWAEHHVGIALFALPVYALTGNPVLAYWVIWLVAFPLNGLAMQALAYRVTRDRVAAFGAGLVYAFCFFRMHHAHGHLQMLWTWALPLIPLAIARWVEHPSLVRAAVVAALVVLQALSSWYLAVFAALLSLSALLFLLSRRRVAPAHVVSGSIALAASAWLLAWFATPYLRVRAGGSVEAAGNAADLASYLVPPQNTWLGQLLIEHSAMTPRWIWGEQTLYVGMTALALAVSGGWAWRKNADRLSASVLAAGAVAFFLSLGPWNGWSVYDLFAQLPAMSLVRAPARFAVVVMVALALLVSVAVADFRIRLRRVAPWALAALAVLGLSESYVINFPGGKPARMAIPDLYRDLRTLAPGAIVSLPSYADSPEAFREADYLLFSTAHWYPTLNGFGRQNPPGHGPTMQTVSRFPDPDAVQRLCDLQVRYVVLHADRAERLKEAAARAESEPGISLVRHDGNAWLFRVCG